MPNELSLGDVVEGKVTAIKEYGAFVSLLSGRSGLVHISQIASEYVKHVEDYLAIGDKVNVKVIDLSNGRISLSIKQVEPLTRKDGQKPNNEKPNRNRDNDQNHGKNYSKRLSENTLEEKLKKWMKTSEERIQELQSKQKRK